MKQEVTGYIVVHRVCRDAAESADESGVQTRFLGFGGTRAAALLGVGEKLDEQAQYGDDYLFDLSVLGATEELLDALKTFDFMADTDSLRWYCRSGQARLAKGWT